MDGQGSSRSRAHSKAPAAAPPAKSPASGGASALLADLPSNGLFSSTVLSSNLGGVRVYVCEHDTSPPEEQIIKTNTTNILIRALQLNKHKSEQKDVSKTGKEINKGKRSAGKSLDERIPSKRANTGGSSSSARQEGSTTGLSERNLQCLTVEKLRSLLKERGLSPKGKRMN